MRRALLLLVLIGAGLALAGPVRGQVEFFAWWLTSDEPPTVWLDAPGGPVRGVVELRPYVGPPGRAAIASIAVDGRELPPGNPIRLDTTALPDGEHRLVAVARDFSRRQNQATAAATIRTDNTPPRLTVQLEPDRPAEGRTALLRVRSSEPGELSADLADRPVGPLRLWTRGDYAWAVVGFSLDGAPFSEWTSAGPHAVRLRLVATDAAGNRAEETIDRPVDPTETPVERLDLPPDSEALLAPEVRQEEERRLWEEVYRRADGAAPRWREPFLKPVDGPVTTRFGTRRSYNGGPVGTPHAGADFGAPAGAIVRAPAPARVVLVDRLKLRGTTLVLDHGAGVYTTYAHLERTEVGPGDTVERGQPIARVGSTGLSTGPHLHWELWVGGVNVDPLEWTERSFP